MNEEQKTDEKQQLAMDLLAAKDLYGQRHIAYFDPSCKFEHVEPIEQVENEDHTSQIPINGHAIKNVSSRS